MRACIFRLIPLSLAGQTMLGMQAIEPAKFFAGAVGYARAPFRDRALMHADKLRYVLLDYPGLFQVGYLL